MDYRSFAWLNLLPADTRFETGGAPRTFVTLLESVSNEAGTGRTTYLAWQSNASALPDLASYDAVVAVNPDGRMATTLARAGFSHVRAFSALPSLSDTRWLLPLDSVPVSISSLRLADPWRFRDRTKKRLISAAARVGQLQRFGDVLVLACRSPSELEAKLEESLGCSPLFLGLKTGPPRTMRKTTVQVMREDGTILAYAKLATTSGGQAVVSREIEMLRDLARHRGVAGAVPRVLGTLATERYFASILSAGPDVRGPAEFDESHRVFLAALADATGCMMTFRNSAMWRDMESKFDWLEPNLPVSWRSRLLASLRALEETIGRRHLLLSTAHRDFGPWNTRQNPDGSLFVFDWDGAHREMTPLYDLIGFHYLDYGNFRKSENPIELVQRLLDICHRWMPEIDHTLTPHLLLAYLTEAALGRLMGSLRRSDLASDEILTSIAELLDERAEWLPDSSLVAELV